MATERDSVTYQQPTSSPVGRDTLTNLPVMKLVGLYQCLKPDGPRLLDLHVFKCGAAALAAYILTFCVMDVLSAYHCSGEFTQITKYAMLFVSGLNTVFKLYYTVSRADAIWDCLRATSFRFLRCGRPDDPVLRAGRSLSITGTTCFLVMWTVVITLWITAPLLVSNSAPLTIETRDGLRRYRYNSINLALPAVTDAFYNRYYAFFYVAESFSFLCCAHATFVFDLLVISMSLTIVYQLKTVARLYGRLASASERHVTSRFVQNQHSANTISYNDKKNTFYLKMLIKDQQLIFKKTKEIFEVFRPIVFLQLFSESVTIILTPLLIVMNIYNNQSILSLSNVTLIITLVTVLAHLFITCFLFTVINDQKDSMNFALYCSNWTEMSVENQKLVLYTMRMNDAEMTKLKISSRRIINLEMFAQVINKSYAIFSVLVKSYNSL